jgi:aminopeptidase N
MVKREKRENSEKRERLLVKTFASFVIFACFALSPGFPMKATSEFNSDSPPAEGVSRELARARASSISDVRYRLALQLAPGAARLKGDEEIRLKLATASNPIILDFRDLDQNGKVIEGTIDNLSVNRRPATGSKQINGHIVIPAKYFRPGENTISLEFETGIAPAGRPLIRYSDRDDGAEYVYTLFVPMDASLAFPCFDQPDLKARFKLEITAPSSWTVIGNENIEKIEPATTPDYRRTGFFETRPISAYLFAFAAGPFKQIAGAGAPAPTRLYVRQSKLQRAQEEWPEALRLTREGMGHFIRFFDHGFPFSKYDQVLIPGFAFGGMEHAGATFLREDAILFRSTPTKDDKLRRASLILHELAHQWFGDLVTMRWFDDLWLKEGFANFMAYHAMAAIYDRNEIWKRFYQAHKPLAYNIDATKGSTPIYQEVRNLKDAKSAYGAIVYQKAPSLLRALSFVIGEDNFRDGVRTFLKEHAYGNAEWNDLIRAFETASRQKLDRWAESWVKRRGMPQIDVEWSCDSQGVIDRFELKQVDVLNEGGLWPISARLLLAYDDAPPAQLNLRFDGPRARLSEAIGGKCPVYVFGNDGDFGYGRFMLDERSRRAVIERIGGVKDVFLRTMLWGGLWDAVRETRMDPGEYIALAMKSLPGENDEELTQSLLDRVTRASQRYLSATQQNSYLPQIESLWADRMIKSSNAGLRITYFRAFRALATTDDARRRLEEILEGEFLIPGVEIKQLDRWQIIASLLSKQDPEAERLLDAEAARDASDDGRKQAYIAGAARADAATKRRYFDDYLKNRAIPEDWIEASLQPFNSLNQSEITFPYLKPALEALPQVKRERKIFFVLAWLNAFIGGQRSEEALNEVRDFLRLNKIDRDLELKVFEVMDELERTVKIRKLFEEKTKQTK